MITERLWAVVRAIDGLLDDTDVARADDPPLVAAAISALRARDATALDAATPYLWEYYRDVAAEVGTGEDGVPDIPAGSEIWEHVELARPPTAFLGGTALEPSPCYLSFEGEVAWETEHGLQLVLDLGGAVCKVGPYDGTSRSPTRSLIPGCSTRSTGDVMGVTVEACRSVGTGSVPAASEPQNEGDLRWTPRPSPTPSPSRSPRSCSAP